MAEKSEREIGSERLENKPWVISRDRITENIADFAKSSRLHPVKNSDPLKGIK